MDMNPLLVSVTVFLVAILFVGVVYFVIWEMPERKKRQSIKKRFDSISEIKVRTSSSEELNVLKSDLLSDVPAVHQLLLQLLWHEPYTRQLKRWISQADLTLNVGTFLLISSVFFAGGFSLTYRLLPLLPLNLLAGVSLGLLPLCYLMFKRKRRLNRFEAMFPEALDLLTRAVKAGHAFNTGISMIAEEMDDPVGKEFQIMFDEQNFGLPLKQALFNLIARVPLLDLKFFVTAVLMQRETGGDLAELLTNLAHLIRERFKIMGQVRSFSAQGRLTGYILSAVPIAMGAIISSMNWDYMKVLFEEKTGHYMLAVAGFCQILGYIIISKIVKIKV